MSCKDCKDKEKKFMDDKLIRDVIPSKLITEYFNNTDNLKDVDNIIHSWDIANRCLYLGDIDEDVAATVFQLIRFWNQVDAKDGIDPAERIPIKVYVDSGGGSVTGALTIADAFSLSKTPVYTINVGCAYSGGLLSFIAGHRRYTLPSASFLFHEGSTDPGHIDAGKFRNFTEYYEQLIQRMKKYFLERTDMTEEMYKDKYRDDWWFFAEEAVEMGMADEILEEII